MANLRDRATIAGRLQLTKSAFVDKPTKITRDLVVPDVAVRGKLSRRPGALGYAITISDARTRRVIDTKKGELKLDDDFFTKVKLIGPDLIRRICNPPGPPPPPLPPSPPADVTAPAVSLTSPANGSTIGTGTPVFSGIAGTAPGDSNEIRVRIYSGSTATGLPLQTLTATRGAGSAYAVKSAGAQPQRHVHRARRAVRCAPATPASARRTRSRSHDAVLIGAGDIAGCGSGDGDAQTAALLAQHPDAIVFTLGDNAYPSGQPSEYANCYGPTWGVHKARTRPITGDHDTEPGRAARLRTRASPTTSARSSHRSARPPQTGSRPTTAMTWGPGMSSR